MKILVLIKQTFDTEAKIVLDEKGQISQKDLNFITNPYDEFALEEAIRLKEAVGGEVVVLTLGPDHAEKILRNALALGADRAIHLQADLAGWTDSTQVAHYLARAIEKEGGFDLLLAGWVAVDDGAGVVPGYLGQLLGLPVVNVVTKITAAADSLECSKEGDGLTETIKVPLPCLVTVQKGINEPRYPTMKNIMAAKKKPVHTLDLSELGAYEAKTMIQSFSLPPSKQAGQQVQDEGGNSVPQLVAFLKERLPGL